MRTSLERGCLLDHGFQVLLTACPEALAQRNRAETAKWAKAIRDAGGVAVDIGSLMDLWAGMQGTRGAMRLNPWLCAPYSGPGALPG